MTCSTKDTNFDPNYEMGDFANDLSNAMDNASAAGDALSAMPGYAGEISRFAKGVGVLDYAFELYDNPSYYTAGRMTATIGGAAGGGVIGADLALAALIGTAGLGVALSAPVTGAILGAGALIGGILGSEAMEGAFDEFFGGYAPSQDSLDVSDQLSDEMSMSQDGSGHEPGSVPCDDPNAPSQGGFGDAMSNPPITPLVLDLDGDGIELTNLFGSTTQFDLDADGFAERTGWVSGDDGLLAIDTNANGKIDNINELFGNSSTDGFIELSALDSNQDGVIDANDAQFGDLLVWQDSNGNGQSTDGGELHTLASLGITSISLTTSNIDQIQNGHEITTGSTYAMNGQTYDIVDVLFQNDQTNTSYILPDNFILNSAVYSLPQLRGFGEATDLWVAMSQDSTLLNMVQSITDADYSSFTYSDFKQDVEALLFQWAGTQNVDPATRDQYINGQILETIEVFSGVEWDPANYQNIFNLFSISGEPLQNSAAHLEDMWDAYVDGVASKLLIQIPRSIQEKAVFDVVEAMKTYEANNSTTIDQLTDAQIESIFGQIFTDAATEYANHPLRLYADLEFDYTANTIAGSFTDLINALVTDQPTVPSELDAYWQDHLDLLNAVARTQELTDAEYDAALTGTYLDSITSSAVSTLREGITLYGTEGNDILVGTNADDFIFGNSSAYNANETTDGSDTISGGLGNDRLEGRDGNDTYLYNLGDGNDVISDQAGTDVLKFGVGITLNDLTFTRTEYDDLILAHRDDANDLTITLSSGETILIEDNYDDGSVIETIEFSDGSTIGWQQVLDLAGFYYGDSSDNRIEGSSVNDRYNGGAGNDIIEGGAGDDVLEGGDGDDILIGESGVDSYDGGNGFDTVDFSYSTSGWNINLSSQTAVNGSITETITSIEAVVGAFGSDTITGDANDNILDGWRGNDVLSGGDGNDVLIGGLGTDSFDGGNGFDFADFTYSNDDWVFDLVNNTASVPSESSSESMVNIEGIYGGDGDDQFIGNALDNIFFGNDGSDTLNGGDGDDQLYGGADADNLYGGNGNDTYISGGGADYLLLESGIDTILVSSVLDSSYSSGADYVSGFTQGEDFIDLSSIGINNISELSTYNSGAYTEISHSTSGFVLGFNGNYTFTANDFLLSTSLHELNGTSSNDSLIGSNGNDLIQGFEGADDLFGYAGDDVIISGTGGDYILLGSGNDTVRFDSLEDSSFAYGGDYIGDFVVGEDKLDVSALGYSDTSSFSLYTTGSYTEISDSTTGFVVAFNGSYSISDDMFIFTPEQTYQTPPNLVFGTNGNDTLYGTSGHDLIRGLAGNDDIFAGAENDEVQSGAGADYILLGTGDDIFSFNSVSDSSVADGVDYIGDFVQGEDKIDVSALGYTDVSDFTIYSSSSYSEISDSSTGLALGFNGQFTFTNDDFIF